MVEGLKSLINILSDLPTSSVELKQFDHNLKPMILKLSNCLLDSGTSDCLTSDSALNCDFVTEILPREISLNNAIGQKSDPCIRSAFPIIIILESLRGVGSNPTSVTRCNKTRLHLWGVFQIGVKLRVN